MNVYGKLVDFYDWQLKKLGYSSWSEAHDEQAEYIDQMLKHDPEYQAYRLANSQDLKS